MIDMELFSFVVEYSDGSIEDLTSEQAYSKEEVTQATDSFINETLPGRWNKIVIMAEGNP